MAERPQRIKLSKSSYQKARKVLDFMKPYAGLYSIGWLFLLLSSVMAMLFPALMGQLLGANDDEAAMINVGSLDFTSINVILTALLVAFAVQAVFSFFRVVIFNHVTENALRDLKLVAFEKLSFLPMTYFNRNKVGELSSRIATDINLLRDTLNTTIAELFRQVVSIVIAMSFILYISWELALWMLAVVPLLAVVAIVFARYIRRLSKTAQDESAKSNSILEEMLTGIFNVKAFTNERYESKRFADKIAAVRLLNIRSGIVRGLFVSFIIFCMFGGIAFVIWKAKEMQSAGVISLAEFNTFILYTIFLGASFGSIPDLYAQVQKAIGATEQLMIILEEPEEEGADGLDPGILTGNVTFTDVSFSYPVRQEIQVLNNISFTCGSGQTTALVGSSGSGKSTIASLMLKLYKVDSGMISYDGHPITSLANKALRSQIAVVPQEVILFGGTIRENILYGKTDASDEEMIAAARQANAYDFIMGFPEKFETLVGDRGIQLSGGQKQRVAIARAVLKNPKILILDEATSALDSESEKLVQDALDKLMVGRTSVVIAHRMSTIKNADNILVLDKGRIVEQGKHEELILNSEGIYYKLNNLQGKNVDV